MPRQRRRRRRRRTHAPTTAHGNELPQWRRRPRIITIYDTGPRAHAHAPVDLLESVAFLTHTAPPPPHSIRLRLSAVAAPRRTHARRSRTQRGHYRRTVTIGPLGAVCRWLKYRLTVSKYYLFRPRAPTRLFVRGSFSRSVRTRTL